MKFGQHLENNIFPPWRNEYIEYNQLKYFLKDRQINYGWKEQDEMYFTETLLIHELDKVNGFIYLKMKQVGLDARKITDLIQFIQLNDVGFYKILKKHDKWTGISLLNSIRFRGLHDQFESIVTQLSQNLRLVDSTKEQVEEDTVEKVTTTKYWIHSDNLTEVQAILMFHLNPTSSNIINTVYFDDPSNFTLYSNLLERNQDAEIILAQWYGSTNNNADLYFERKTHHESWIENKGSYTKERFHLTTNKVDQYLSWGNYNNNVHSKSIFQSMQKNRLKSTLRSYYHRTTYSSSETLHLSLDKDLTFFQETPWQSSWRRNDVGDEYPFSHLNQNEVYFFPYAILEVKTKFNAQAPQWLTDLVEVNQLLYEVPYFSKFLHGVSHFYKDSLPLLPWWLGEMNIDIRRKSSYATIQSQTSSLGQCIVIEPSLTPDYLNINTNNYRGIESKDINHINSNTASSFTIVDQQKQLNNIHHQQEDSSHTKSSPLEKFMNSSIILKIKELNEEYNPKQERAENYVSMMSWLSAKIRNDQALLLSPQYPIATIQNQQIMPKKGKLNKKKIEPKIFFANERTFISWLQFSALLLSVSLGLINFGDHISKASGGFFIIIAMILAGYSQLRFQYRAWQIRFRGDSRFDDTYGPAILSIVLVIALFVNLALRLNQPIPEHPTPFGANNTKVNDAIVKLNNSTVIINNNHRYPNGTKIHHKKEEEEEEA